MPNTSIPSLHLSIRRLVSLPRLGVFSFGVFTLWLVVNEAARLRCFINNIELRQ